MSRSRTFTLIMATYGRSAEVGEFLRSVVASQYDLSKVQILIVDQNDQIDLTPILVPYRDVLQIKHIRMDKKGLSCSRNAGLREARGEIVCFPDDDCEYLPETLAQINEQFAKHEAALLLTGRVVNRDLTNSIRNWSPKQSKLTRFNFLTRYSSVTMFFRRDVFAQLSFNELLGVGAPYGSYEDADIVYRALKLGPAVYVPEVKVYHPDNLGMNMSTAKTYSYGLGFGGFCRANLDVPILWQFVQVFGFHSLKWAVGLVTMNREAADLRSAAVRSRIRGLMRYRQAEVKGMGS